VQVRKLQRTSDGTFFTTLPKSWVEKWGMGAGTMLSFFEREDGKIIVSPYGEVERKIEAATLTPSPMLERDIEEKYLLGYDVIEVISKEMIEPAVREGVKKTLKLLVGLEIVEENSKKIVMQCLIEPSLLNPEKILRRLHLITMAMQKDAFQSILVGDPKLAGSVVERDEEVDRLYFLLVRLVRAAVSEPSLGEKLSIRPIDCLDYRLLASLMESFADHSVILAESAVGLLDWKRPKRLVEQLDGISGLIHEMYKDSVGAVLSRDLKFAARVATKYEEAQLLLKEFEKGVLEGPQNAVERLTTVIMALSRMCELNVDIADLAIMR